MSLAQQENKKLTVLFISSFSKDLPAQLAIESGLDQSLNYTEGEHNLFYEFMDIPRLQASSRLDETFAHFLEEKYRNIKFDFVVGWAPEAITFITLQGNLFPEARRIYIEQTADIKQSLTGNEIIIGVKNDYRKSLEQALTIEHPKKIVVIGTSQDSTAKNRLQCFKTALAEIHYEGEVEYLLDRPLSEVLERLANLPRRDTMAFYLLMFSDGKGIQMSPYSVATRLASQSAVPIYSHWESLMGSGVVGGCLLSPGKVSYYLGQSLLAVKRGETLPEFSPMRDIYDWTAMEKWEINKNKIPADALFINQPLPLLAHYKYWFSVLLLSVILLTCIIFVLVKNLTKRKQAESAYQKAQERLQVSLQEAEKRSTELSVLLKGTRSILKYADFLTTARSIFDYCRDLIGATSGYVALLSDNGEENEVLFLEAGGLPCTVDPSLPMPIRGLRAEVYRTGMAQFDNTFSKSEWMQFMPSGHVELRNVLFAPLTLDDKVVGLLGIANKENGFDDNDAHIATAFGGLAAIALQNSLNLDSLKKRDEELAALNRQLENKVAERTQKILKTSEELKRSKDEWERTFNAIPDIVTLQDIDMKIVKINQAGCDTLGTTCGQIVGTHCYELFDDINEPCPNCPLLKTQQTFEPYSREMTHVKLGKIFLVSASAVVDENGRLTHIAHIAKDVTEKKKIEEELFQSQKMEAMGTLAGGIAHDFNNILTAIMGYAELAQNTLPAESTAHEDIEQVLLAGNRATDLVHHILSFSRKSDHALKPLEPHLIIKESMKMLRASLPATVSIKEDIDTQCGKIMADPTSIHQIIVNLCTNAFHAMEREKGVLSVRLYRKDIPFANIRDEQNVTNGEFIVLEVSDTGRGIAPRDLGRVFEPYFTTKEEGKGTGLGLAVIHGIVKDFHGFIRVKSKPGAGSTFFVHLPALRSEISSPEKIEMEKDVPTGTERVLVVDDEEPITGLMKSILEKLGYTVTAVNSSRAALEKIGADLDQFDLVITDQTMPELAGDELAREILSIQPDMPIILCTGFSSVLDEEAALAIGIKKYLKKPVSRMELARACRDVLDKA